MCEHEGSRCPRHCRCECMNCMFRAELRLAWREQRAASRPRKS